MQNTQRLTLVFGAFCLALTAQKPAGNAGQWVATWSTAQQLAVRQPPAAGGNRGGALARGGGGAQAGRGGPARLPVPKSLSDQTIRMVVHTSIGGSQVRIEISNMINAAPLEVGSAHIGVHKGGGDVTPGTDHVLTFGGRPSLTVPPGALALSDPVVMEVAPLSDLAVSLYLPRDSGAPTIHTLGLRTAYISHGDVTFGESMPDPVKTQSYLWLSGVDVLAPRDAFAIVALGDSITDGYGTTSDMERAWPALLARRLAADKAMRHVAVINQGISGNQLLRDGAGVSALARFDRDVLSRPGVKWIILLEGINDINIRGRSEAPGSLTADELISGYQQLIERCHTYGIRAVGATIMPEEGVPTASERGERIRQTVNKWIRAKGNFDAVVDFDQVVRDPERPLHLKAEFDPGDHIHPNDAGNQAMADAFDLRVFSKVLGRKP